MHVCVERSGCVQQGGDDERRFPGGFQTLSGDELRHVPGRRQSGRGRPSTHEMLQSTSSLRAHSQPLGIQVHCVSKKGPPVNSL